MAPPGVAPVLAAAMAIAALAATLTSVRAIGVCYGVIGDGLPSAGDVVQLYKSNGIDSMRIYFADPNALEALKGSNIGVIMDIGNENVRAFASDANAAAAWVKNNVQAFPDVAFRYIAVGNEVAGGDTQSILPAMQNVDKALAAAGLGRVKASTAVQSGVTTGFPPSQGAFSSDAAGYMAPIAKYLAGTGAPLLANVYPYFAYKDDQPSSTTVHDSNGLTYTNLFGAMVDTFHAALDKAGAGDVKVVVSESGWPSADGRGATVDNARTYNQNLIDHAGKGTPRKPGAMEVYVFAMFNENRKDGDPTEKKFGLFNPDKSPVYTINFAGK